LGLAFSIGVRAWMWCLNLMVHNITSLSATYRCLTTHAMLLLVLWGQGSSCPLRLYPRNGPPFFVLDVLLTRMYGSVKQFDRLQGLGLQLPQLVKMVHCLL